MTWSGVALEPIGVEMAMAVDEPHPGIPSGCLGLAASSRGKSGSGAVIRPASPAWAPHASSSRIGGPPLPSGPYG